MTPPLTIAYSPAPESVVCNSFNLLTALLAMAFCIASLMLLLAPLYLRPGRSDS